ncbi:probable G-protein coupled receptor [Betta splendens]|uniref:Probable G-protein coupled receptor n=1 Tax=Betta splendens TaxID=158456 RepID=A0A6P7MHM0_BETSP|nr:probable G-protein coupled receptor [Betta splendens]
MGENGSFLTPGSNDSAGLRPEPSAPQRLGALPGAHAGFQDLARTVLMVAVDALALLANTAVLIAVVKAPHLRKFAFVGHLCAVDLLCAVLLMPLGIVSGSPYFAGVELTVAQCRLYVFLNAALVAASIFTITAISVERYYYIVHPMRYEVRMTLRLTAAVVAAVWAAAAGLGLSAALGWPASRGGSVSAARCSRHWSHSEHRRALSVLFSVACFCVPSAVIFAVYCSVYKVARVAARHHGPLPSWTSARRKPRSDSVSSRATIITTRSAPRGTARERPFGGAKAALTLVLIVGQFLICWLPYFAFHLHLTLNASPNAARDLREAVTWLAYSSFAVNPFFYGLLNRQIREELWKLRRCYSARPVELPVSSHEGSGHENFLQFLHRTSCTTETSPGTTLGHAEQTGFRIPGQIPEELS